MPYNSLNIIRKTSFKKHTHTKTRTQRNLTHTHKNTHLPKYTPPPQLTRNELLGRLLATAGRNLKDGKVSYGEHATRGHQLAHLSRYYGLQLSSCGSGSGGDGGGWRGGGRWWWWGGLIHLGGLVGWEVRGWG